MQQNWLLPSLFAYSDLLTYIPIASNSGCQRLIKIRMNICGANEMFRQKNTI